MNTDTLVVVLMWFVCYNGFDMHRSSAKGMEFLFASLPSTLVFEISTFMNYFPFYYIHNLKMLELLLLDGNLRNLGISQLNLIVKSERFHICRFFLFRSCFFEKLNLSTVESYKLIMLCWKWNFTSPKT